MDQPEEYGVVRWVFIALLVLAEIPVVLLFIELAETLLHAR